MLRHMVNETPKRYMAVTAALAGIAVLASAQKAHAGAYSSGITTSGSNISFVLNENADNVTVFFDGGTSSQNLGALSAGTQTFSLSGHTSYQIQVSDNGPVGYTANGSTPFYSPKGISVNTLPNTANFGDIYISESTTGTTTVSTPTARTAGFYKLRADSTQEDYGLAALTRTGSQTYGKTTIGPDGILYNADFSSDLAFQISDDLDSNVQLIDASNKTPDTSSTTNNAQFVHSIAVTGTGAGRQIFLANSNFNDTTTKGVIRYNLTGTAVAPNDLGTRVVDGADVDNYYASDVEIDNSGNIFVAVNRSATGQANPIVKLDSAGNVLFEVPNSFADANSLALSEALGLVAYASFEEGIVNIFDTDDLSFIESFDAGGPIRDLAFDAVGNIYTVSSSDELLKVFSRGAGETRFATTGSDGTFSLTAVPEPTSLALFGLGSLFCIRRRRA